MATVQQDLLSLTLMKLAIFTVNQARGIYYFCTIFVVERAKMFSKVARAALFKTKYSLIAFVVVDL